MSDIVFDICRVAATVAGLFVAYYVIPALKVVVQNHIDSNITGFINSAVYAAQQTLTDNSMKKKYVVKTVSEWLNERNIKITDEQLDILIESAVLAMKTETK
jgi:hypothetical protein